MTVPFEEGTIVNSDLTLEDIDALLPSLNLPSTGATIEIPAENQYLLSWQNDINFSDIFGANNLLPDLIINDSSLLVTDLGASNSYEFTGNVAIGNESFGIGTNLTEQNNQLDWDTVTVENVSLASLGDELKGGFEEVGDFLGDLGEIDLSFSKDEGGSIDFDVVSDFLDFTYSDNSNFSLSLNDNINFTTLFSLDNFLPDLTISDATFTAASEGESTNFDFNGQIGIANQNFGFNSSFTSDSDGLDWNELGIENFDLGSLASEIPGLQEVNDFVGGLGTIDLSLSKDNGAITFTGAEDLADLENSDYSLEYAGSDDFSFTFNNEANLTALFNINSFLPDFTIGNATFIGTTEGGTTNFDLSGEIGIANQDPFTLTGSFAKDTNGLSWQELGIEGLNIGSLVSTIPGLGVVETWVGDAATVDLSVAKDENGNNEYAIALPQTINLTSLFNLNSFLPKLTIGEATFTVGKENNISVYGLSGIVGIGSLDYEIETQFTGDSSGNSLSWDSATIKDLDFGGLVSEIGGGISKVDSIFGSIIPEIDLTLSSDEISFQGIEVDFASSNDRALNWISDQLGLGTVALDFSYMSSGDVSVSANIGGNIDLISTNKFSADLNNLALDFSISGTDAEPSFKLDGNLSLFVDNQYLDLSGGIAFEPESITGYFLLDTEQAWIDPFGISDTEIRQLGFQIGASYLTAIDNVGFIGDLKFNEYDFRSAFLVDLNDPDNFALELTLNESISVATLITGGPAGLAISQLGQEGQALITNTTDFLDDYLDFNISSIDSDGDGELDPLIKIVPVATTIAGVTIEEGFGINGTIDIFGKEAIVAINGDLDSGQVQGSIEVDRIDFGIDGVYEDILVVEGSDNYNDKENGTLVGNATVIDRSNDGTLFGNSTVSDGVLSLDGSGDYVQVNGDSNLDLSTDGTFTIEAWINPNVPDNLYYGLFGYQPNGAVKQR
ncbi:MAG: hypothetical protein QNJ38_13265, partial [Prochloraceae cyanobacterium]|nr:hypothetical protein [Prochloraceae cyanobacterium]